MHKNKIVLTLALGLLLSPFFAVQAVTATNTAPVPKIDEAKMAELKANLMKETAIIKQNIETSNAGLTKVLENTKDNTKIKLEAKAQEKVKALLDIIYTKLSSKIDKLSEVDRKILLKIGTAEAAKVDVSEIKTQYTVAKTALDKANADVLSTRMNSFEQIYIETSKETLRLLVKTAENSIKAAATEYQKLIPLLSVLNSEINKVETTTTTTVTQ